MYSSYNFASAASRSLSSIEPLTSSSEAWAHHTSGGCIKSEILPPQCDCGNCVSLREVNADWGMGTWNEEKWMEEEMNLVRKGWIDWMVFRRWMEDGEHEGEKEWRDGCERRCVWDEWAVRLKINQRGSVVRSSITTRTHTHIQTDACVRTLMFWLTHMQTQIHWLTYSLVHILPHGEVVKGHGWLDAGGWFCPEWQSRACWDVWIQMQSSVKAWGRSPLFSLFLSSFRF